MGVRIKTRDVKERVNRINRGNIFILPIRILGLILKDIAIGIFGSSPGNGNLIRGDTGSREMGDRVTVIHTRRDDSQLDLVLHRKTVAGRVGSPHSIVVRPIAIHIHGTVRGAAEHAAGKSTAPCHVLVHNDTEIRVSIILERSVKLDCGPLTSRESHFTFIHLVGVGDCQP